MVKHEKHLSAIREKNGKINHYENHEKNNFIVEEDIIGLDANVLVDIVNSSEFREDLKAQLTFILKIYTTEIALGEARQVLIRKKKYTPENATKKLQETLKEFGIEMIFHDDASDNLGTRWVNIVRSKMRIKKFSTFPNDCKIVSNLYNQKKINSYYTEDKDIRKAIQILHLKIIVKILPEATDLSNKKITKYFKEKKASFYK